MKTPATPARTPAEAARLVEANLKLAYFLVNQLLTRLPYDRPDKDELVSLALFKLWRAALYYRGGGPASFGTYAGKGIRRALWQHLDRLRRQRRRQRGAVVLSLDAFEDPAGLAGRDDPEPDGVQAEACAALLGRLTPRERQVVTLLAAGVSGDEAAPLLGVSVSRFYQARRQAAVRLLRRDGSGVRRAPRLRPMKAPPPERKGPAATPK